VARLLARKRLLVEAVVAICIATLVRTAFVTRWNYAQGR
jgi:hypothetical protein